MSGPWPQFISKLLNVYRAGGGGSLIRVSSLGKDSYKNNLFEITAFIREETYIMDSLGSFKIRNVKRKDYGIISKW